MSFEIRQGDVIAELRNMPSESVHCVVTSPPYWGLRSYSVPAQVWGGLPDCPHVWGTSVKARQELAADGTRVRRNSDWFMDSWQGLLSDPNGEPVAMVVNPQPFSIEMCSVCRTCFERRDYQKFQKGAGEQRICPCGAQSWVSHFATFNERMVLPCILAGTSEHGCCHHCGAPYERILKAGYYGDWHPNGGRGHNSKTVNNTAKMATSMVRRAKNGDPVNSIAKKNGAHDQVYRPPATIGWRPTCSHPLFPSESIPCTVLDPFTGSGTVGLVALQHGRNFVGIELRSEYAEMAQWRINLSRCATEEQVAGNSQ